MLNNKPFAEALQSIRNRPAYRQVDRRLVYIDPDPVQPPPPPSKRVPGFFATLKGALVAAFQAWARNKGRSLADHLVARGDLDADARAAVEALVALHLKKPGDDDETSLASIPAGRSSGERSAL